MPLNSYSTTPSSQRPKRRKRRNFSWQHEPQSFNWQHEPKQSFSWQHEPKHQFSWQHEPKHSFNWQSDLISRSYDWDTSSKTF